LEVISATFCGLRNQISTQLELTSLLSGMIPTARAVFAPLARLVRLCTAVHKNARAFEFSSGRAPFFARFHL
jgi:hypothetical protein